MPYVGQTITDVFPTSINVDSATIKGDTTIGDASAADKKILFDGNAQDYHIGLDDSTDSLTIGLGSALGTTSHMVFDANGIITKPLQPAFQVRPASTQENLAVNSHTTIAFGTEIFDVNGDFASNTFTAPVTGKYMLTVSIYFNNLDISSNYYIIQFVTSNRNYDYVVDTSSKDEDEPYSTYSVSALADMDASDTAYINIFVSAGAAQADISTGSFFTGYLVA